MNELVKTNSVVDCPLHVCDCENDEMFFQVIFSSPVKNASFPA